MEKIQYENSQYMRRSNVEISGIPDIFDDTQLESKVIEVCNKIGVKIEKSDIECCHRMYRKKGDLYPKKIFYILRKDF